MALDFGSMGELVKQAQEMQKKVGDMQAELAAREVSAASGGGMVRVTANGAQEILSIRIEKEVLNDPDMLADLVLAAVNEALKKSQEMVALEMEKLTGGLKLPGLPGLFG